MLIAVHFSSLNPKISIFTLAISCLANSNLPISVYPHSKRSCVCILVFSSPDPEADHCLPSPLLETPGHLQASLGQSLVRSLLLSPGSWWAQGFVCALQENVYPVRCKFCSQILLASKVKFPGVLSLFARSPGWEISLGPRTLLTV